MTKRLSIALIAVALFVLLAVMPASAITLNPNNFNGTQIDTGATVFIGEQGLNLTHALNGVDQGITTSGPLLDHIPTNLSIGWWASAAQIGSSAPTKTINLGPAANGRYLNFQVAPADFVGYTGNWYELGADGTSAQWGVATTASPIAVFNVQDPSLTVGAWDFVQQKDVTGMSVPQGTHLGVQVNTNMYAVTYGNRNNTVFNSSFDFPAAGPNYFVMPNNAPSLWADSNWSGVFNGSYIVDQSTNVWVIKNYSFAIKTTYPTTTDPLSGVYTTMYWNNSPAPAATGLPYDWTGQNFTSDPQGLDGVSLEAGTWVPVQATSNYVLSPTPATDGFINIKVKDEAGATLTKLFVGDNVIPGNYKAVSTMYQFVNIQPWYFGTDTHDATHVGYWVTDALDTNNQYAYPVGTYSVWAEANVNGMKDNYKNAGADYTGKTVSPTGTVTLVSDTVKIEANKDSVVRSKSFSVTITGKPSTQYFLWVKGTNAMDSSYDNQPPMINVNQLKVYFDNDVAAGGFSPTTGAAIGSTHPIGDYQYDNGAHAIIYNDVATGGSNVFNRTRFYAMINTSTSGTSTIEWITNNWTKAQKYTIRVEQNMPAGPSGYGAAYGNGTVKSDEVDINVEKGAVTIVAAGDQSYYLGEEIKFSGTNTETYKTYLFMVGPNLPAQGAKISDPDPRYAGTANPGITNGQPVDFKAVDVNGDNTWSWKWGTANYALDAGTYTIYAVSQPYDKNHLANSAYGTVSIIIKKPFVSATASQSTVAKGDRVYITGTAEGDPNSVQVWIMGKNYAVKDSASVNSDASFKYEVKQETTKTLSSGQYFVVVQHPMQNKQFDVDTYTTGNNDVWVVNKQLIASGATISTANFTKIFKLLGAGSLQGSDAAEALAQGINDANVDDTYTKLQFLVEEPIIRVDAIGDKHVGDKFTITAQTNLAVDDEVLVQVYSSSFKPTQKSQSGEFSGATGTIKVTKGDSGMNKLSFDVDSSTFKPDEYIVTEDAVLQVATGTALFNVLETSAQTVAPTAVVTAAPTVVQTAVPTAVATAAPTATPTKSPGFGALIALIGLGAVAFVVVRRH